MTRTPQQTFDELIDRVGRLVAGDHGQAEALAGLYAETTDVSFPMAPATAPLQSRADVQAHFAAVASQLAAEVSSLHAEGVRWHDTTDPEVVIAEFRYAVETPQGRSALPNVFVMRVRDGEIVESRDYSGGMA